MFARGISETGIVDPDGTRVRGSEPRFRDTQYINIMGSTKNFQVEDTGPR